MLRRFRLSSLGLIILVSCTASAQSDSVEQLKKCVAFLFGQVHVKGPNGDLLKAEGGKPILLDMPLGTAFFIWYPDKRGGETYGFSYLVTAKHVLRDADETFLREVRIRLNLRVPANDSDFGTAPVPVLDSAGKFLWFTDNDDPGNDVAVVPLLPDTEKVDFKTVPINLFADDEVLRTQKVSEGDALYLFGLMPQYYGERKNYPVVRKGSLALLTDELIQTGPNTKQHVFLAELASWPGNSGAPVFLNLGGFRNNGIMAGTNFSLLGLMLGYFSNVRQAELINTRTIVGGDPSNIGISYILPASTIRKVLDSAALQQLRDADIAAHARQQQVH